MRKKFLAFLRRGVPAALLVALLVSFIPVQSQALDIVEGIKNVTLWQLQTIADANSWWLDGIKAVISALGQDTTTDTQEQFEDLIARYNATVQSELGGYAVCDEGYIIPIKMSGITYNGGHVSIIEYNDYPMYSVAQKRIQGSWYESSQQWQFDIPFDLNYSYSIPEYGKISYRLDIITDFQNGYYLQDVIAVRSNTNYRLPNWLAKGTFKVIEGYFQARLDINDKTELMEWQPLAIRACFVYTPDSWNGIETQTAAVGGEQARAGSIVSGYTYFDGSTTQYFEDKRIIQEDSRTFYNPVTNQTENFNTFTYDYSTHTYQLEKEDGEKISVTYGDEYVTINEGATVYNIYYAVEDTTEPTNPGTTDPTNPGTTDPTNPGTTDPTDPTDPGTTDPTDPGGDDGGDGLLDRLLELIGKFFGEILGGIFTVLGNALAGVLDALIGVAQAVMDRLTAFVDLFLGILQKIPELFTGFFDFLRAFFGFLPPQAMIIVDIIILGIGLMVLAAVIKVVVR